VQVKNGWNLAPVSLTCSVLISKYCMSNMAHYFTAEKLFIAMYVWYFLS